MNSDQWAPHRDALDQQTLLQTFRTMGERKQRQRGSRRVLHDNPLCIYCGGPATTTDHCPPRCFFEGRQWPEGYEFSACHACNQEGRSDEQMLAVLVRTRVPGGTSSLAVQEWSKLFTGVLNNQPEVMAEWRVDVPRNVVRRRLRDAFGPAGDGMRRAGYGVLDMGPLTKAAIGRFMVKLGKALYWKHNGELFKGVLYLRHISSLEKAFTPEFLDRLLHLAPEGVTLCRNSKLLDDQFTYRFNHSPPNGAFYAVVRFSEQFILQVIAISAEMDVRLQADGHARDLSSSPEVVRYECHLGHAS